MVFTYNKGQEERVLDSIYKKIDLTTVNIPMEIDRWESVLSMNETNLQTGTLDKSICYGLIDTAKRNLEYLRDLSPYPQLV